MGGVNYEDDGEGGGETIFGFADTSTQFMITDDYEDIDDYVEDTPQTWNLALAGGAIDITTYLNNEDASFDTKAEAETFLGTLGVGALPIQCWVPSYFTYTGGAYSTATITETADCPAPLPTIIDDFIDPAGIFGFYVEGAVVLDNSSNNVFTSPTITGADVAMTIENFSEGNSVSGGTFTTNTIDVYSWSDSDTTFSDTTLSTVTVVGEGTVTGYSSPNTAPTGTFNSATSFTDGSGDVTVSIEVDDVDDNDTSARLEYETDSDGACDGPWSRGTLRGTTTADFSDSGGVPDLVVGSYQIGSTATTRIITSSSSNTVTFTWDSDTDLSTADGTQCLRLTVNDDTVDQTTPATQTVSVDNVSPSGLTALSASSTTYDRATLSWREASDTNFDHYEIWYGTNRSDVDNRTGTASEIDNTNSSSYYNSGSAAADFSSSSETSLILTGLSANTTYYTKIWAIDGSGNSETVDYADVTTSNQPTSFTSRSSGTSSTDTDRGVESSVDVESEGELDVDSDRESSADGDFDLVEYLEYEIEEMEDLERSDEETVTEEHLTEAEISEHRELLEESTRTTQDVFTETVYIIEGSFEGADRVEEIELVLSPEVIDEAIEVYENTLNGETGVEIESDVVGEATMADMFDVETLDDVQAVVEDSVLNSLETALEESVNSGSGGLFIYFDEVVVEVDDIDDVEVVVSEAFSDEELAEIEEEIEENEGILLKVDETSNYDNDCMVDIYQLSSVGSLFDNDVDGDGRDNCVEKFMGTDPLIEDDVLCETQVTNLEGAVTGDRPSIRVSSCSSGDEVDIVLIEKDLRDDLVSLKQKASYASVILADSVVPSVNQIPLGRTVVDEEQKGEFTPEEPIPEGEYYVIVAGQDGIGKASSFEIDNDRVPSAPEIEVTETKDGLRPIIYLVLIFAENVTPGFNKDNYLAEFEGEDGIIEERIMRGYAEPGSVVYVTWKSRILSSIVISDASQGEFELQIPEGLLEGEHEVLAYVFDEDRNLLSNVTSLLFRK